MVTVVFQAFRISTGKKYSQEVRHQAMTVPIFLLNITTMLC